MSTVSYLKKIADRQLEDILDFKKEPGDLIHQKPDISSWSTLEILDHLIKTSDIYLSSAKKTISRLDSKNSPLDQYSYSWIGKLAVKTMKPVKGKRKMKMKTFPKLSPADNLNRNEIFEKYVKQRTRMHELINEARFVDHNNYKINSALGSLVKFKIMEAFEFLLAHEERHILQARETLQMLK